jgi:hypothetical protein
MNFYYQFCINLEEKVMPHSLFLMDGQETSPSLGVSQSSQKGSEQTKKTHDKSRVQRRTINYPQRVVSEYGTDLGVALYFDA